MFKNQKSEAAEALAAAIEDSLQEELSIIELEERLEMIAASDEAVVDFCEELGIGVS